MEIVPKWALPMARLGMRLQIATAKWNASLLTDAEYAALIKDIELEAARI